MRESGLGLVGGEDLSQQIARGPLSVEDDSDIFFRQPTLVGVDGERFLFQVPDEEVRDRTIEVVLNWPLLVADNE